MLIKLKFYCLFLFSSQVLANATLHLRKACIAIVIGRLNQMAQIGMIIAVKIAMEMST
jgi:hypothetical protein